MENAPSSPLLLSIKETCRQLGDVSRPFVYSLLRDHRLTAVKIDRRNLIVESSVRKLAKETARGE